MKPCSNKRKLIVLLTLYELNSFEAQELRSHLQSCEGCRHYLEEISSVTKKLTSLQTTPEIEASDAFHSKVLVRLRARGPTTAWEVTRILGNLLNWRVALPVIAVAVAVIVELPIQRQESNIVVHPSAPPPVQIASMPDVNSNMLPTIANYQMVANQSVQKLDELLNDQAKITLPSTPVYTVSMLALANSLQ